MNRPSWFYCAAVPVLSLFLTPAATAQTAAARHYVTFTGGANIERAEDNLAGSSGAGGLSVARAISPKWLAEIELWFPGFIESGSPDAGKRHRDVLVNAVFVRPFGGTRVRPFAVVGLGAGVTQDRFALCTALRPPFGGGQNAPTVVSCGEPDVVTRHEERHDAVSLFGVAGLGTEIHATSRISIVPEIRLNMLGTSVITRPSVGVRIAF